MRIMVYWGLVLVAITFMPANLQATEVAKEVVIDRDQLSRNLSELLKNSTIAILNEDGSRVKVQIIGWVDKAALRDGRLETEDPRQVDIVAWRIESLPRDYGRPRAPFNENISAYVQVRNRSREELAGMLLGVRFLDREGHLLHTEEIRYETALPAGKTGGLQRFWYAENNEFVANDPFDILRPAIDSGSLRLEFQVEDVLFRCNSAAGAAGKVAFPP